jgi:hypothetical protein
MRNRTWLVVVAGLVVVGLALPVPTPAETESYEPAPIREVSVEDSDQTYVGEEPGDWAGYFASPAGDVNGDGLGDLLIGAPLAGNKVCPYPDDPCPGQLKGEGETYLILGRHESERGPDPIDLGEADASFLGCEVESMTGRQIYTAGDVNGDGCDDFLISGWKCGANYTGKAFLFLGRRDVDWGKRFPVEQADASFLGEAERDRLSYYTATAGDVNGDGYDDFLITSTFNDEAASDAGQVYLILGRAEPDWGLDFPVSQADASFLGTAEDDRLGRSAHGVNDVNGDGYDDFVISSISSDSRAPDAGETYLFLGRPGGAADLWGMDFQVRHADASFVGETEGDESGRRAFPVGDVNGDGYADFLIGAARNDHGGDDAGIAYLILGRAAADWGLQYPLTNADASFIGEVPEDQAGRRGSGPGDVNGDGYDDFIIGAPHNTRGGPFAGAAYLVYGRAAADWGRQYPLAEVDVVYVGKPDVRSAGYDSGGLGDFNGDAMNDYYVAAFGGRNEATSPGEVYVFYGSDRPAVQGFRSNLAEGHLAQWHWFTGAYWDPNGWDDFAELELLLESPEDKALTVNILYTAISNTIYLRNRDLVTWTGPCVLGAEMRLSNEFVTLDCLNSRLRSLGAGTMEANWRVRWLPTAPVREPVTLTARLRAMDQAGHDTGLQLAGTWVLINWRGWLPLVLRADTPAADSDR